MKVVKFALYEQLIAINIGREVMKNKDDILKALETTGWKLSSEDDFIVNHLIPPLTSLIADDEQILAGLAGLELDDKQEATDEKELILATKKQLILVQAKSDEEGAKPVTKVHPIAELQKIETQPATDLEEVVDVLVMFNNDLWSIQASEDQLVQHFEKTVHQLVPKPKMDEETFDTTIKAETINIAQDAKPQPTGEDIETIKKGNWFTHFFTSLSFKGLFKNLEFWNYVSLIMAVAVLVTASIATAGSQKKGVYIPNGIFTLIFGLIGMFSTVLISMIRWDNAKFSIDLYRSLFGVLIYLLTFIFGIVFAADARGSEGVGAVEIVLAVLLIFDGGYTIVRQHLN